MVIRAVNHPWDGRRGQAKQDNYVNTCSSIGVQVNAQPWTNAGLNQVLILHHNQLLGPRRWVYCWISGLDSPSGFLRNHLGTVFCSQILQSINFLWFSHRLSQQCILAPISNSLEKWISLNASHYLVCAPASFFQSPERIYRIIDQTLATMLELGLAEICETPARCLILQHCFIHDKCHRTIQHIVKERKNQKLLKKKKRAGEERQCEFTLKLHISAGDDSTVLNTKQSWSVEHLELSQHISLDQREKAETISSMLTLEQPGSPLN